MTYIFSSSAEMNFQLGLRYHTAVEIMYTVNIMYRI